MKAVIALGNPGEKYENTRHNIGFLVADHLSRKLTGEWHEEAMSLVFHTHVGGEKILIAKPQTYMNLSGNAAHTLIKKYDLNIEDIVIIYDEIDLPFGEVRVRKNGGTAGHNGVASIIEKVGTDEIVRVRMGIGSDQAVRGRSLASEADRRGNDFATRPSLADYVLEEFTKVEKEKLPEIIENATSRLHKLLKFGYEEFISKYNK